MSEKIYMVKGQDMKLYTIGELCTRLERENQTVRKWEKAGLIPPAQFRSKTGRRLYTELQIAAIVKVVEKYNLRQGCQIPESFKEEVYKAFADASSV
jgi:hypothetical protein